MRWRWLATPVPIMLAALLATALFSGRLANPIFFLRADLGVLLLAFGAGFSALLAAAMVARGYLRRVQRQATSESQAEAATERRRFLLRLDHELKNPLTAIRAGLANLAGEQAPEQRREIARSIESQALRIGRLAADLRKLAELETRALQPTAVDLSELLPEALALAREQPTARERQLTLTLPRAPWPVSTVSGDRDLLFLAVYNLLDNALKFSRSGDTIELRAFEDRNAVTVEIADTGPGLPEAEASHVWEELYRGKAAQGVPGSGLGLALVRAIAELHGGQVALRSREGQGTVVTLRLPA